MEELKNNIDELVRNNSNCNCLYVVMDKNENKAYCGGNTDVYDSFAMAQIIIEAISEMLGFTEDEVIKYLKIGIGQKKKEGDEECITKAIAE